MAARGLLLWAMWAVAIFGVRGAPRRPEVQEVFGDKLRRDYFSCQLSLSKRPDIHKVELIAYNLLLPNHKQRVNNYTIIEEDASNTFERLDFKAPPSSGNKNRLHLSTLDPSLPFTFFINGFNHSKLSAWMRINHYLCDGAINGSWFEGVSNALSRLASNNKIHLEKSNVIFLSWRVTGILTSDTLGMPLAYYRTMANYDLIMDEIEIILSNIVDFIEETQAGGSWYDDTGGRFSGLARANHYEKFKFYAHSLGSHLVSNAIDLVHQSKPWVRFGKLVGLDPALPCFLDDNHGLSADRMNGSVGQVQIIHSNAAFSGVYTERGSIDIVLNGGTFQPACHWYDFTCSHVRSNEIFTYVDDQCEMVAYWCTKYEQFKYGACETCDNNMRRPNGSQQFSNCVLVNLPEQHVDSSELLMLDDDGQVRQLDYDNDDELADYEQNSSQPVGGSEKSESLFIKESKLRKAFGFHFVNTNADFLSSNTHCLQHYQLRLLTLTDDPQGLVKCPLSSYFLANFKEIQIKLLTDGLGENQNYSPPSWHSSGDAKTGGGKKLTTIVDDKLYTGLVTFSGQPRLFVGSIIDSIDLEKWSTCLINEQLGGGIRFTLDIAFMSHTKSSIINEKSNSEQIITQTFRKIMKYYRFGMPSVRHAYSSILCGQWNPYHKHQDDYLVLTLCKPTELSDISGQIDKILNQIGFHHQYDSWKVSLLDNLFYLYSKWEPLR